MRSSMLLQLLATGIFADKHTNSEGAEERVEPDEDFGVMRAIDVLYVLREGNIFGVVVIIARAGVEDKD